jgi:hypothetical protein
MLYFEHKSNSMQSLLGRIQISIRETNRASACNWHSTRVVQVDGVTSKDYPSEEIVPQFPLYIPRPLLSVRSITWTTVHAKLQFLRGSAIITYLLINQRENSGHGWRLAIGPNWQELNDPLVFIHKWLVSSISTHSSATQICSSEELPYPFQNYARSSKLSSTTQLQDPDLMVELISLPLAFLNWGRSIMESHASTQ